MFKRKTDTQVTTQDYHELSPEDMALADRITWLQQYGKLTFFQFDGGAWYGSIEMFNSIRQGQVKISLGGCAASSKNGYYLTFEAVVAELMRLVADAVRRER